MSRPWGVGNRVRLLENGEEFSPRAPATIGEARAGIMTGPFIEFEDKVATRIHTALAAVAKRRVHVALTVDGYRSPDLSPEHAATSRRSTDQALIANGYLLPTAAVAPAAPVAALSPGPRHPDDRRR